MRPPLLLASILIAGSSLFALADESATRTGAAAYGDWRSDAPGVRRKLTAADMPAPGATRSVANPSRVVARPDGALPKAPEGFAVSLFASGLDEPRVVRVAPNGDVFVAESAAGRVTVLSAADGAAKAASAATFAAGLHRPFGIAFTPPGPDPRYVYVAETDRVVRFPYRSGETKAAGPAEIVVAVAAGGPRPLDARPRLLPRRQDDVRLGRLGLQHRRRNAARRRPKDWPPSWRNTRPARPGARRRTAPTCSPSTPTAAA